MTALSSTLFQAQDMYGNDFWIDWDGAEGIGFWVGDPEGESQALDVETSKALVLWFQGWDVHDD